MPAGGAGEAPTSVSRPASRKRGPRTAEALFTGRRLSRAGTRYSRRALAISDHPRDVTISGRAVRIGRTTGGVAALWADDDLGLAAGQGYAHAHDRLVQMELVRLVAQGRLCECLLGDRPNPENDLFMRALGL